MFPKYAQEHLKEKSAAKPGIRAKEFIQEKNESIQPGIFAKEFFEKNNCPRDTAKSKEETDCAKLGNKLIDEYENRRAQPWRGKNGKKYKAMK